MYADVIPLLRMPRTTSTFTYHIPSSLEGMIVIGQTVRVPWRGRSMPAIVESLSETTCIKNTADVESVVETVPSWDVARVAALKQHCHDYFSSFGTMAAAFFPDVPVRAVKKELVAIKDVPIAPANSYHLAKRDIEALQAVAHTDHARIHIHSQAERFFLITSWAKQAAGQVLILVPTLFDAQELALFLSTTLKEPVGVFGGVENKGNRWQRWQHIRDGAYRIVVTTRSGALLPLKKLSCIIIDQDDDQDHRSWEAAPYYDSRTLLDSLAKELGISCRRLSFFPRLSVPATDWQELATSWPPQQVFLHNRAAPLLQEQLTEQLEETLADGKHVLIICTQRAAASAFLCLDCQYRWHCTACHTPLMQRGETLACNHCDRSQPIPDACSRCGGQRLRGFAPGAEALAKQLPLDLKTSAILFKASDDTLTITSLDKPRLILSTPYTWRRFAGKTKIQIGAVLFFQPERILFTPDYRANEWFLRTIAWHRAMVHAYLRLPLLIQSTLLDQHPMLALGASLSWQDWQVQEIKSRQSVHVPPYGVTALVTLKDEHTVLEPEIDTRLRADFDKNVFGPTKEERRVSWFIKLPTEQAQKLDKLNDSVYSKALIYPDPESSV